ncbi:MAG: ribose-phosphate pyrophosphokinase [Clostridia bacterium]|nr:ribose-phosphate pyrophosphokinase [Clostridia bacterium]MBQ3093167.1 ribose-phosphate pyrophosphokinase [Clostridia bacterium]
MMERLKIFTGNSNPSLVQDIAKELGCEVGKSEVSRFSDGEISVSIQESVRGADCFVVQSTCTPINENLMELLIMIDALKRASAERITAIIPYFGYARQDRKAKPRDPISAKLVADLISTAGAHRVLTMELHTLQIQGFFDIPVDHLISAPLFSNYIKEWPEFNPEEFVILAPDFGAVSRARQFSKRIGCPIALVDKRRPKANVSEVMNIIGEVKNKKIILVDDIIDTAGTICNSAKAIVEQGGAKEVYVYAAHGVLSGDAIEKLKTDYIKKITFLNTIEIPEEKMLDKFTVLNIAPVMAEAISRINRGTPFSTMMLE